MKITVSPDNQLYPTRLFIDVKDFKYGEDVETFCKKLEVFLNDLMIDKRKKK